MSFDNKKNHDSVFPFDDKNLGDTSFEWNEPGSESDQEGVTSWWDDPPINNVLDTDSKGGHTFNSLLDRIRDLMESITERRETQKDLRRHRDKSKIRLKDYVFLIKLIAIAAILGFIVLSLKSIMGSMSSIIAVIVLIIILRIIIKLLLGF